MKLLFAQLRAEACDRPVVLLMDEADDLLRTPSQNETTLNSVHAYLKSAWSDLKADCVQIFVFGTTSKPWELKSIDWCGRFNVVEHLGMPTTADRKMLIRHMLGKYDHDVPTDLEAKIVEASEYHTGSDIQDLFETLRVDLVHMMVIEAKSFDQVNG